MLLNHPKGDLIIPVGPEEKVSLVEQLALPNNSFTKTMIPLLEIDPADIYDSLSLFSVLMNCFSAFLEHKNGRDSNLNFSYAF